MSSRDRILARRAAFVAAALATLPAACSKSEDGEIGAPADEANKAKKKPAPAPDAEPVPCLAVPLEDAGVADVAPMPCLSPPPADAGVYPKVCLSIRPPDAGAPKPCLKVAPTDPFE